MISHEGTHDLLGTSPSTSTITNAMVHVAWSWDLVMGMPSRRMPHAPSPRALDWILDKL